MILEATKEWCNEGMQSTLPPPKVRALLWTIPPLGWFKFNVDGGRTGKSQIGARGVIQDSFGYWWSGFVANKGKC